MPALEPRFYAAAVLPVLLVGIFVLCRFLAARSPKATVIWASGGYWALLHLVCLYGLLTSTRFDSGLAQLTLLTFPMSVSLGLHSQGFATLPDLAADYVRFVLCFGGLNALLIAGLLTVVMLGRTPKSRRSAH